MTDAGPWQPGQPLPAGFTTLAHAIYAGDPHWLPESPESLAQTFSAANTWFDNNQAWLGCDGQTRLAGFHNPALTVDGHQPVFFGYFESQDQPQTCTAVFAELEQWARSVGATALYGPINFTTFSAYRIKLDHFDKRPFPGEPYNPEFYPALLETAGFQLRYRYVSRINEDVATMLPGVEAFYAPQRKTLADSFSIRTIDADFWLDHLEALYATVDSIFSNNFAYTAIDFDSFARACGEPFAKRLCPHSSVAAFDSHQQLAGFFLCFPDYSPLLNQGATTRVNAADVDYQQHFSQLPQPRLALAKTGGVHPDYRESGLFNALSCELSLRLEPHFQQVAGAMVREDNPSLRFAARFGDQARHYGLYWKPL